MQNELTYILGAGASFQSIPIVKTFAKRFEEFVLKIELMGRNGGQENNNIRAIGRLSRRFLNEFESHQSFDTYFKKLFHTQQLDLISQGKKILNLYFLWEHLNLPNNKNDKHVEGNFIKTSKIDKRYDALIAGLLKPIASKSEVFCKTNFITWNYDLNLFFSLKNYFSPTNTVKNFLNEISINEFEWNIDNQIHVVNMNGFFYSSELEEMNFLSEIEFTDILNTKITSEYISSTFFDKDSQLIKFAWETDNETSITALDKIAKASNIVVIGYTFPLYNRLTDLKYFSSESLNTKRLYLQDPNSNKILEDIKDNFEIKEKLKYQGDTMTKITSVESCESFFVPNSIYSV